MIKDNYKSFIFYSDWYDAIKSFDDSLRLEIYDAIIQESFGLSCNKLSKSAEIAMGFIRPQIKRDTDKYLEIRKKRSESGRIGGSAKNKQTKQQQANANICNSTNQNNDTKVIADAQKVLKDSKKKVFTPPTVEEVDAYIQEKGFHFDAEEFVGYYEADDWHYGHGSRRKKVESWKRCCLTWEKQRKPTETDMFSQQEDEDYKPKVLVINGQVYR